MMRVSVVASCAWAGSSAKARRQSSDQLRHEQQRHDQQHGLHGEEKCEDAIGKQRRRRRPTAAEHLTIGGHEGRIERALGEDRPEMIG